MPVVSFGETIPRLCVCGGHWSDMQAPMVPGLAETGATGRDDRRGGSEAAIRRSGGLAADGARAEWSLKAGVLEKKKTAGSIGGWSGWPASSPRIGLSRVVKAAGGWEGGQLCRRTSSVGSLDPELQASLRAG